MTYSDNSLKKIADITDSFLVNDIIDNQEAVLAPHCGIIKKKGKNIIMGIEEYTPALYMDRMAWKNTVESVSDAHGGKLVNDTMILVPDDDKLVKYVYDIVEMQNITDDESMYERFLIEIGWGELLRLGRYTPVDMTIEPFFGCNISTGSWIIKPYPDFLGGVLSQPSSMDLVTLHPITEENMDKVNNNDIFHAGAWVREDHFVMKLGNPTLLNAVMKILHPEGWYNPSRYKALDDNVLTTKKKFMEVLQKEWVEDNE